MITRLKILPFFGLALLLWSCTSTGFRQPALPEVRSIPYSIDLEFSSKLDEYYYVYSGPIETYQRIRVNDRFRTLLSDYVLRKGDPSANRVITLQVTLLELQTTYDRLGAAPSPEPVMLAGLAVHGRFPFHLGSDFNDGGDYGQPMEIIKSAKLTVAVAITPPTGQAREEIITVDRTIRIERQYFDSWTYDYSGLINQVLAEALMEIDLLLERSIAG